MAARVARQAPALTVLLVDDHRMFREAVRRRLEQEHGIVVVGEASTGQEALALCRRLSPRVVILDIRLPDISGVEVAKQLKQELPELKILILTGYDYEQYVKALVRIGVNGYVLKGDSLDRLVEAVGDVASGGTVLSPKVASKVMTQITGAQGQGGTPYSELTIREIEVVELLHEGLLNKEIGDRLGLATRTVESHVSSILDKLGAKTRGEVVTIAVEVGLLR